jgi:hypothetical protein
MITISGGKSSRWAARHHVGAVHVGQPQVDEQKRDRSGAETGEPLRPGVDDGDGVALLVR